MYSYSRRRRTSTLSQWKPIGIVAGSALWHVVVFAVLEVPEASFAIDARPPASAQGDAVPGVGGTYRVDIDCTTRAALRAVSGMVLCHVMPIADEATCRADVAQGWRVAQVDCRAVQDAQLAHLELDATPLVDVDSLELEMMPLEQLLEIVDEQRDKDPKLEGQVVDIPKPVTEQRPEDAKYLAEHDMAVEREMVKRGDPAKGLTGPPSPARTELVEPPPRPPPPQPASAQPPGGGALSMRKPGPVEQTSERPRGQPDGFGAPVENGLGAALGALRMSRGDPRGGGPVGPDGAGPGHGPERVPDLRPTPQLIEQATGGSMDHLKGVDEGAYTALNARRWKYASFFNRVKHQVAQNWHPERVYQLRDPTGNIYGSRDRLTVVVVSLAPDGSLHDIVVQQPSGVDFLDDEAVKAFRLAQPFPNPPGALVDRDSQLITFQFGFSFEINSRTQWKVFRYR